MRVYTLQNNQLHVVSETLVSQIEEVKNVDD